MSSTTNPNTDGITNVVNIIDQIITYITIAGHILIAVLLKRYIDKNSNNIKFTKMSDFVTLIITFNLTALFIKLVNLYLVPFIYFKLKKK